MTADATAATPVLDRSQRQNEEPGRPKRPKGAHHTGTISERRPGVFQVRVSYGKDQETGKYIRETHTVRGSRREAERKLRDLLNRHDQHQGPMRDARHLTFGEYATGTESPDGTRSLGAIERNLKAHEATRERMLKLWIRYTSPRLKNTALASLSRAIFAEERDKLLVRRHTRTGKRLSVRTVKLVMSVWGAVLRMAVEEQRLNDTPLRGVTRPEEGRDDVEPLGQALTPEETARLRTVTDQDAFDALWVVLLRLGLRPGEALALKWSDCGEDGLKVQRALKRVGKQWTFGPTKTRRVRIVPLPLDVGQALDRHWERQRQEREAAGEDYQDQRLIFCDPAGRIVAPWSFQKRWKRLLKQAGLPTTFRLYDARHTALTRIVEYGLDFRNVGDVAGNSAKMIAKVYSHGRTELQRRALEATALPAPHLVAYRAPTA